MKTLQPTFLKLHITIYLLVLSVTFTFARQTKKEVESYLHLAESYGFSGQVIVHKDGELLINKALGYHPGGKVKPISEHTLFGIASISKQFTAAAITLLAQRNKLHFDDSLNKYFADVPEDKSKISIHQLLTHSSGLRGGDVIGDYENITEHKMVERIFQTPLDFSPGEKWRYSNVGYNLLALIIEQVSDKSYEQFLTENIFIPAGMHFTRVIGGDNDWNSLDVASCLRDNINSGNPGNWKFNMRTLGGGNIASTAMDLYRWHQALNEFKILNKVSVDLLQQPHVQIYEDEWYGYGWFVFKNKAGEVRLVEHGGDYEKGFNGGFYRYKDKDLTLIILNNKFESVGADLWQRWAIYYPLMKILVDHEDRVDYMQMSLNEAPELEGIFTSSDGKNSVRIEKTPTGPKVFIEGVAATFAFFQTSDTLKSQILEGVSQTDQLVRSLTTGDMLAYKNALKERAEVHEAFANEWLDIIKVNGRVLSYKILGAVPNYFNDGVKCFVRFTHERGTSAMAFGWLNYGSGRLYATYPTDDMELTRKLQQTTSGDWMLYDLFTENHETIQLNDQLNRITLDELQLQKEEGL